MDTNKKNREHISALGDGELPESEVELAFAALQSADGRRAWMTYHRVGDILRAQASPELSDKFDAAIAECLAREPAHVAQGVNGDAASEVAGAAGTSVQPRVIASTP